MCKQNLRSGFTLLEVVISVSILAGMTGLILVMLDAPERLLATRDVQRQSNAKQVQNALEQEFFETSTIEIAMSATPTPICRLGITADVDPDCVSLDYLVPEYIPCLPVDGAEPDTDRTGYAVAFEDIQPSTVALYLGQKGGQNTFCESEAAPIFGDGNLDQGEECDDGNRDNDDGCNEFAMLEDGFNCEQTSINDPTFCDESVVDLPQNAIVAGQSAGFVLPTDIAVSGSKPYAYIVDAHARTFQMYDMQDVDNPQLLYTFADLETEGATTVDSLHYANGIFIDGGYAYIVSGFDGSNVSVSEQDNPLTDEDNALTIFKLNGAAAPTHISTTRDGQGLFTDLHGANDIFVSGDYAFVTAYADHSMTIINVSDPTAPTFVSRIKDGVGSFTQMSYPSSVFVDGNFAYITSFGEGTLTIVDITDVQVPKLAKVVKGDYYAGIKNITQPTKVFVYDNSAFVLSQDKKAMSILNIQDPYTPIQQGYLIGQSNELDSAYDVVVDNNLAYIVSVNADTFVIANVLDRDNPSIIKVIQDSSAPGGDTGLDGASRLALYGSYVYAISRIDRNVIIIGVR